MASRRLARDTTRWRRATSIGSVNADVASSTAVNEGVVVLIPAWTITRSGGIRRSANA